MSLLAVVLPLTAGTIVFLLRAQSQSAEALRDAMALTQLSHTFHADVHAARSARLLTGSKEESGISLELVDDRTVEYRAARFGSDQPRCPPGEGGRASRAVPYRLLPTNVRASRPRSRGRVDDCTAALEHRWREPGDSIGGDPPGSDGRTRRARQHSTLKSKCAPEEVAMNRQSERRAKERGRSRRGVAALIALVCLSLATIIGALLLQGRWPSSATSIAWSCSRRESG